MVTVDLKVTGCGESGMYYPNSQRIIIYLNNHESLIDIYKTIQHELIHHSIEACNEEIDEDQEEQLIFFIQWADFIL